MGAHTLLQRRKYSYVIRKRVPAALVPVLGKREIVKSLGTLNLEEAKRRVRAKANEIDRVFAEARQPADLTPEQVTQLANQWLAAALTEDAEAREEGEFPLRRTRGRCANGRSTRHGNSLLRQIHIRSSSKLTNSCNLPASRT